MNKTQQSIEATVEALQAIAKVDGRKQSGDRKGAEEALKTAQKAYQTALVAYGHMLVACNGFLGRDEQEAFQLMQQAMEELAYQQRRI